MGNIFTKSSWNPYAAGALAGLLAVLSVLATSKLIEKSHYLGTSTSFVRAAGFIEQKIDKESADSNEYYQKTKLKVD